MKTLTLAHLGLAAHHPHRVIIAPARRCRPAARTESAIDPEVCNARR
jgi:hypothetical protein